MALHGVPVQIFELSDGGYVATISYQKANKEHVNFSKYAPDEEALGVLVSECIQRWAERKDE